MAGKKSSEMTMDLQSILEKRRKGEISTSEFYRHLLILLRDVSDSLLQELDSGMDEEYIKEQIPLILTILREQIGGLRDRGR
ncbi:MAG: hypothetical protein GXO39_02285 [Thermotogae bacterium]|nr:hypothetical protein [Thermotogota bacterium]